MTDNITISNAHKRTQEYLSSHYIVEWAFESRIIFEDLLNYPPQSIKLNGDKLLTSHELNILNDCLEQRLTGKPLAYIIGKSFFWDNFFKVNEHTLIPRQDTETLIETIIKLYPNHSLDLNILDLGTGSGCIVLSLLKEYTNSQAIAIDISNDTLQVAQDNAVSLNLANKVEFINSSWFDALDCHRHKFHIIVSNPPYIDVNDPNIDNNVDKFEPKQALYAKNNGLESYEVIISQARKFLKPKGKLILEIGWQQWESIEKIAIKHDFSSYLLKDISHNPRCVVIESK